MSSRVDWEKVRRCAYSAVFLLVFPVMTIILTSLPGHGAALTYTIVDTGQETCFNDRGRIPPPWQGQPFYGQDAQYSGILPSYRDNRDGTVTDLNTGLIWQKTPPKQPITWNDAQPYAERLVLAGQDDWRLPTIKELYSLIVFQGSIRTLTPYIDTRYFDFYYPARSQGRIIDAQYWTATRYVGTTMHGNETVFGVNFADGRIKGYPIGANPRGFYKKNYIRCVRGGKDYGQNRFVDSGNGVITDLATGLMWAKSDSGKSMNWVEALAHAENLELAGHSDWRLPNAKELQSIVDYTRAPAAVNPAQRGPAIDPIFEITKTESWFWTSTSHGDGPPGQSTAVYICFGRAFGFDRRGGQWLDVHGAGAQRSDPKSGNPSAYPRGRGPQGDEIRIYNYVRAVRNMDEQ